MPGIDLTGFDTQHKAAAAVAEVMSDWTEGYVTNREALGIINAIIHEWRQ